MKLKMIMSTSVRFVVRKMHKTVLFSLLPPRKPSRRMVSGSSGHLQLVILAKTCVLMAVACNTLFLHSCERHYSLVDPLFTER